MGITLRSLIQCCGRTRRKGGQCEGSQIPRKGYPDRDHDAYQVPVVQLIDSEVLTVEQAEHVFDGAAKRSARLKDVSPDAERVIQHLHDELNWDKYYKWAADRRKNRQERN
jgi:hypothetical protein